MKEIHVRRERRLFSAGGNPARQLSFWPVAVGVTAEVTKPLEPPMERVAMGDSASMWAVM